MKSFLIDPKKKTVVEVDYDGDYRSIYGFIEGNSFLARRLNLSGDVAYFDPEHHNGKALVLGTDEEGESVAPTIALAELRALLPTWRT